MLSAVLTQGARDRCMSSLSVNELKQLLSLFNIEC